MHIDFSLVADLFSFISALMHSPLFWKIWLTCASVNLILLYPASATWYQLHDSRRSWTSEDVQDELIRRAQMWKVMAFFVRGREGRYLTTWQVTRTVLFYVAPATALCALALTALAASRDLLEGLRRLIVAVPGPRQ